MMADKPFTPCPQTVDAIVEWLAQRRDISRAGAWGLHHRLILAWRAFRHPSAFMAAIWEMPRINIAAGEPFKGDSND